MAQVNSENTTSMPVDETRRRFLSQAAGLAAGGTALALATIPPASAATAPASPLASGEPDPIFAMIAMHKKLTADWQGLYNQLQKAEFNAAKEHGHRPIALIHWRDYYIGASEIDTRRETLLEAGEIDPATVEQEYLDAKARYEAQVAAGLAWDERAGLATLRNDVDRRVAATRRYEKRRLACTMPTTAAGVAALIQYVLDDDLCDDEDYWHMTALRSAVAALNNMSAAVTS